MNRITIDEQDLTLAATAESNNEIIYIPGFVNENFANSSSTFPGVRVPTVCDSLSAFHKYFGSTAPVFASNQDWPASGNFKFADVAITDTYMFAAGDIDPSYVYAKELITQGFTVIYEAFNTVLGTSPTAVQTPAVLDLYKGLALESYKYENAGEWSSSSTYAEDDIVKMTTTTSSTTTTIYYRCKIAVTISSSTTPADDVATTPTYYKCKTAVTSATTTNPASDTDHWVATTDETDIANASEWSSSSTYAVDTVVKITPVHYWEEIESDDEDIIANAFNVEGPLSNTQDYSFKYLTSGGYPTFEFAGNAISRMMLQLCAGRGDAIAFIDHTDNGDRKLTGTNSVYAAIKDWSVEDAYGTYGTMITPYGHYSLSYVYDTTATTTTMELPGSFGYFKALSNVLATSNSWSAVAGVANGYVPSLQSLCTPNGVLSNRTADSYQVDLSATISDPTISINAITYIKGYGYCIMGNRTVLATKTANASKASNFLNLRNMMCTIKKQVYSAAMARLFQQNSDFLWVNFKNDVGKILDEIQSSYGIRKYKIIKTSSDTDINLTCTIYIYPTYAVEAISIGITLTDSDITVE